MLLLHFDGCNSSLSLATIMAASKGGEVKERETERGSSGGDCVFLWIAPRRARSLADEAGLLLLPLQLATASNNSAGRQLPIDWHAVARYRRRRTTLCPTPFSQCLVGAKKTKVEWLLCCCTLMMMMMM